MPSQHTLVPVGMMGVQTKSRPTDDLTGDLQLIYQGDTSFAPEACNAVHDYQDTEQQSDPPGGTRQEQAVNQYTNVVRKAHLASGGTLTSAGRLKCLVADFTQKNLPHYFYDNNLNPDLTTVSGFVDQFVNNLKPIPGQQPDLTNNVLGGIWRMKSVIRLAVAPSPLCNNSPISARQLTMPKKRKIKREAGP